MHFEVAKKVLFDARRAVRLDASRSSADKLVVKKLQVFKGGQGEALGFF